MRKFRQWIYICLPIGIFCLACNNSTVQASHPEKPSSYKPFKLSSPDFTDGGLIPELYTCDSSNISPALQWNIPFSGIGSFALIMDDPDVPTQPRVHWLVY